MLNDEDNPWGWRHEGPGGGRRMNENSKQWEQIVKEFRINQRTTELHSPWQNQAEGEI
jgi:hypothetical protein